MAASSQVSPRKAVHKVGEHLIQNSPLVLTDSAEGSAERGQIFMKSAANYLKQALGLGTVTVALSGAIALGGAPTEGSPYRARETQRPTEQRIGDHGFLVNNWHNQMLTMAMASRPEYEKDSPKSPTLSTVNICIMDVAPAEDRYAVLQRIQQVEGAVKGALMRWWEAVDQRYFPLGHIRRPESDIHVAAKVLEVPANGIVPKNFLELCESSLGSPGSETLTNPWDLTVLIRHQHGDEKSLSGHFTVAAGGVLFDLGVYLLLGREFRNDFISLRFNKDGSIYGPEDPVFSRDFPGTTFESLITHEVGHVLGAEDTYEWKEINGKMTRVNKERPESTGTIRQPDSIMSIGRFDKNGELWPDDKNFANCMYCNTTFEGSRAPNSGCQELLESPKCCDLNGGKCEKGNDL